MATTIRYDSCLTLFWLMGSVIIVITIMALLSIAVPELTDLSHLVSVATESDVIEAILITMVAALVAVVFLVIFGTPLAYVLARSTFRGKGIVENIVDIPLALPHTVAGLMVYLLFMSRGPIGAPFNSIGIVFEDAFAGIVVAMIFVSSPYYINAVREGFEKGPGPPRKCCPDAGSDPVPCIPEYHPPPVHPPPALRLITCMGTCSRGVCGRDYDRILPDGCVHAHLPAVHDRWACREQECCLHHDHYLYRCVRCLPVVNPDGGEV